MNRPNSEIAEEVHAVRTGVGLWLRDDHTFVRITGPDAASWLQSQTTNDVEALEPGQGHHNALLDRQGRLQAHFTLHRWEDEFWMLVEAGQAPRLLEQLDAHLFIEDAQVEETGGDLDQVLLQGPNALPFLASFLDSAEALGSALLPRDLHGAHPIEILGYEVLAFNASTTGEDGFVFVLEKGQGKQLMAALLGESDGQVRVILPEAQEVLRIEAGIPHFGVDMDTSHVISGTTLERDCVSYEKGCYLGQEVVARLKAYGSVKRALMGLVFQGMDSLPVPPGPADGTPGLEIRSGENRIGSMTSWCYSPTLDAPIALAYLDRDHRSPGAVLEIALGDVGDQARAEVRVLPLYAATTKEERAHALYDDALELFQADLSDEDTSAISLLDEAILLDPDFEDAYEVQGVILHRQGQTDEAIRTMLRLAELNPDCLMAHTNLSVFYVAKGMIQEAEVEKAKSAVLEIQKISDEHAARHAAEAERQRLEEEARERIGMFEEVLEIDPDDPVATFGMGKAYVQLGEYENAIPHLQRATEVQKDFSAAYLDLGKCHEFVGHAPEAIGAYREGIAVASRKGDLMPLREMERRLKSLSEQETPAG
ncbi:MAG: tetratricopeptide repeat protein [Candidatus Hydrogenedentes bacterium]|nr:tetratricopeptide repeat protein [Candidatus Hydrogenedentota bacterium]